MCNSSSFKFKNKIKVWDSHKIGQKTSSHFSLPLAFGFQVLKGNLLMRNEAKNIVMLEGTYFWEQGCHFCYCHMYSLGAGYIAAKRCIVLFIM